MYAGGWGLGAGGWRLEARGRQNQATSGATERAGGRGEDLILGEDHLQASIESFLCGYLYPKSRPLLSTSVSPSIRHGQGIPILAQCPYLELGFMWFWAVGIEASGEGCHSPVPVAGLFYWACVAVIGWWLLRSQVAQLDCLCSL